MFYDLNIVWTANTAELQRTLAFAADLGYSVVAVNHIIAGKIPNDLKSPIPNPLPFATPPGLKVLRRCTLVVADPTQNHRLATLGAEYDLLALRPTTEKALQLAMASPETDLISLDMTQRFQFYFRPKLFSAALQRGLRLEVSYGGGAAASGNGLAGATARRNLISNATSLIRATRGRGLMLSSEARRALECRAPFDAMNLAAVWGLAPERAREAVTTQARATVAAARSRRHSFRGVVEIITPSVQPADVDAEKAASNVPIAKDTGSAAPEVEMQPADSREGIGDNREDDGDDDETTAAQAPASKRPRPQQTKRGQQASPAHRNKAHSAKVKKGKP